MNWGLAWFYGWLFWFMGFDVESAAAVEVGGNSSTHERITLHRRRATPAHPTAFDLFLRFPSAETASAALVLAAKQAEIGPTGTVVRLTVPAINRVTPYENPPYEVRINCR